MAFILVIFYYRMASLGISRFPIYIKYVIFKKNYNLA